MNSIIDKLIENHHISYHELYTICKEFLENIKNNEIVDIESLVLCFGTFLEVIPHLHLRTMSERWLNVMINTLQELSLNSYRTCNTIYHDSHETHQSCLCTICTICTRWLGCVNVELSEAGMMYKYPIDKKIDYLIDKHFSSSSEILESSRIYDIISEYFENHTEQKYTKIYVDSLILGIYISVHTINQNNNENNQNNNGNDELFPSFPLFTLFIKYIKHLLRNERIQREHMKFVYGHYSNLS